MSIRITSKRDGFRRCKVEHPSNPTVYSDNRFTPAELAILEAEPMLIVERIPNDPAATVGGSDTTKGNAATELEFAPLEKKNLAELKEYAGDLDIDFGEAKTKADFIALIKAEEAKRNGN
jgi:hypothetical protein